MNPAKRNTTTTLQHSKHYHHHHNNNNSYYEATTTTNCFATFTFRAVQMKLKWLSESKMRERERGKEGERARVF
jgi:hypothetical protein